MGGQSILSKKKIKMNLVLGYAPTTDSQEEEKLDFYEQIQASLISISE
jgi:hypothetical protein